VLPHFCRAHLDVGAEDELSLPPNREIGRLAWVPRTLADAGLQTSAANCGVAGVEARSDPPTGGQGLLWRAATSDWVRPPRERQSRLR
jgi:hypothetical protein